jgi:hypothetical protein
MVKKIFWYKIFKWFESSSLSLYSLRLMDRLTVYEAVYLSSTLRENIKGTYSNLKKASIAGSTPAKYQIPNKVSCKNAPWSSGQRRRSLKPKSPVQIGSG